MSTSGIDVETIISELGELNEEQLGEVLDHLNFQDQPEGKKNRYKAIVRYLLSDDLQSQEDQGVPILEDLDEKIRTFVSRRPPTKRDRLSGFQFPSRNVSDFQEPAPLTEDDRFQNLLMKEFKITGKIDGKDGKDSLSYSSLCFQIQNGLKRGYKEFHIVNAVIKAISPVHPLRQYLEGRETVTFSEMSRILRYYFREKDAASLFTTLVNARQDPQEPVGDFLLRLMNLRHKILFVARGEEDDKGFSPAFVQKNFLHSALTGLRDDHIRAQLRPLLKCVDITDEEIMAGIMEILSEETAHEDKLKRPKKAITGGINEIEATPPPKPEKRNPLKEDIEEIRGQIAELTSLFQACGGPTCCAAVARKNFRGPGQCQNCVQNKVDKCTHCFNCGSEEHYWAGCKQKND